MIARFGRPVAQLLPGGGAALSRNEAVRTAKSSGSLLRLLKPGLSLLRLHMKTSLVGHDQAFSLLDSNYALAYRHEFTSSKRHQLIKQSSHLISTEA